MPEGTAGEVAGEFLRKRRLGDIALRSFPRLALGCGPAEALRAMLDSHLVALPLLRGTQPAGVLSIWRAWELREAGAKRVGEEDLLRPCCLEAGLPVVDVPKQGVSFPILVVSQGELVGLVDERQLLWAYASDSSLFHQCLLTLLDALQEGVVVVDPEGRVRFINPEARRLLGERCPSPELLQALRGDRAVLRRHERWGEHEVLVSRIPLRWRGSLLGAVEVVQDLRPLRELEALRGWQRMVEMVFESALEGLVVVDRQGVVRYINRRCAELLGRPPEEILGRPITEFTGEAELPPFLREGRQEPGRLMRVGDRELVVKRVPLRDEGGALWGGAGVVLLESGELEELLRRVELLEAKVRTYRRRLHREYASFEDILGQSPALLRAKEVAMRAANTDLPVLLVGETGTGKELFAQAIHRASPRRAEALVSLNCAAIPGQLLEAELFGYERGAFTGAHRPKPGRIELADGGTLFLDEIADMPLSMQAKLLRVLETKEVEPVGGLRPRRVDFRLICATHQDPDRLVEEGRFRADLLYRMEVIRIDLPPLRERREDIPLLAEEFLRRIERELGRRLSLSEEALELLRRHSWPGNVRELLHVLEAAACMAEGHLIRPEDLHLTPAVRGLREELQLLERRRLIDALRSCDGNVRRASRLLGIDRTLLYKKLRRYGLDPDRFRP